MFTSWRSMYTKVQREGFHLHFLPFYVFSVFNWIRMGKNAAESKKMVEFVWNYNAVS